MALKPLDPAAHVPLSEGWELTAAEAGRSNQGLRATVALFNGTGKAVRTVTLGDQHEQQALVGDFAQTAGLPDTMLQAALVELAIAVEGLLREQDNDAEEARETQATRLIKLAEVSELFHTPDGDAYTTIPVDQHRETWPLRVKGFRRWLSRQFYEAEDKAPGSQALNDALDVLEGRACFDGMEHPVYTRLAAYNNAIYLDLVNEAWQAVEITSSGWRVMADPPVKFRRARGMLQLPMPITGGSLDELRTLLNLNGEDDWRLLASWLLATLRPTGPYPVLVLHGEQGSAKSTLTRMLRSLVDPNQAALRTTPRDERDLVIAANNGWLIALDNLSHLPAWLSDALCRLATGSGFATRELYSDAEETIFVAQRPIAMNGIEELATRGDLLDRSILLYLPSIPEDNRKQEATFWRDVEAARPRLLGALLDAVSHALRTLPSVTLARVPRMADFATWACAAAPACGWTTDDFLAAYTRNRNAANDLTLDASPVAPVLREFVERAQSWSGTTGELLAALEHKAGEQVTKQKAWPKSPRALSNTLRRLAPTLRASQVDVTFPQGSRKHGRTLTLEWGRKASSPPSPPSPSKENQGFRGDETGDATAQGGRKPSPRGRKGDANHHPATPHGSREGTQGDGGDATIPTHSNWEEEI